MPDKEDKRDIGHAMFGFNEPRPSRTEASQPPAAPPVAPSRIDLADVSVEIQESPFALTIVPHGSGTIGGKTILKTGTPAFELGTVAAASGKFERVAGQTQPFVREIVILKRVRNEGDGAT